MDSGMAAVGLMFVMASVINGHSPSVEAGVEWATSSCWYATSRSIGQVRATLPRSRLSR